MKGKVLKILLCMVISASLCACKSVKSENEIYVSVDFVDAGNADVKKVYSPEIKDSDYYFDYSQGEYVDVVFDESNVSVNGEGVSVGDGFITITKKGTYVLSGNFNGTVNVDIDNEEKNVYLVLNNVNINAENGPAIYESTADKLIILLPAGTKNSLSDSKNYSDEAKEAGVATIYANDDLTICGEGELNVTGNANDGISTRDDCKLMGGEINIYAVDDCIVGKDLCYVYDGNLTLTAGGHGLKSTNDEDEDKGYLVIDGGNINVLKSYEGMQAERIIINDGEIIIEADDDGINANGGNGVTPCIYINGGSIYVNAYGDGLDSNGKIEMNGGFVYVSGAQNDGNNATDYQSEFVMCGGTIIACGTSGMYQSISEESTCFAIDYICESNIPAGTECKLLDGGTVLCTFTMVKQGNAILIAGSELENEKEYELVIGSNTVKATAGEGLTAGGWGPMGAGRPMGGERPMDGERPMGGEHPMDGKGPMGGEHPMDGERPMGGERPMDGEGPIGGEHPMRGFEKP